MAQITVNGITLDPMAQAPGLAAANLISVDATSSDYILIQTKVPLTADQKKELKTLNVDILEYVPEDTYLCHFKPADLNPIRGLPFISWANTYLRGFKIAPALLPGPDQAKTANLLSATIVPSCVLSRQPVKVDVMLHIGASMSDTLPKIATAARLDAKTLQPSGNKVRITVQVRYLKDLAAIDEVRHIEDVVPLKLHNNVARQIIDIDPASAGSPPIPYEGAGQLVGIADTGLDTGNPAAIHPALAGRVKKIYPLGRPGDGSDPDGHGTHVAGSALGDGNSPTYGPIRGAAPKAELIFQSVLDASGKLGGLPSNLNDLFLPPYNDGVRVHSNSWGDTHGDGSYSADSREVDEFVWNHRDCVIVFAAGNSGVDSHASGRVDPGSVGAPSTAKNCLTVGATENRRPGYRITPTSPPLTYGLGWPSDFPVPPISTDQVADNPEGMAAFSGRGPTTDSRIKPDVTAPGTAILSCRTTATTNPGRWSDSADPAYMFDGGTSMATPLVAGCTALVREFLIDKHGLASPSAALVKALLINSAHDIAGQYIPSEAGDIPNIAEGFGRVQVAAVFEPSVVVVKDESHTLDTGEQDSFLQLVPAGAQRLKVTLVWTDPPGESLQNDLDLIVTTSDGKEQHGNMPAASTAFDRTNNVEQIVWNLPQPGNAKIVVRAFRVVSQLQSYAVVVRIE